MHRDFITYLHDIHDAGDWIHLFTLGMDKEIFASLEEKRSAGEREFEIIGKAITQCRRHYPLEVELLGELQAVVDFRNYLAHRYHAVASDIIWDIVENDLPPLLARVKSLLQIGIAR